MDQPRTRYPVLKSPIILRDHLQSPQQRTINGVLTVAFWAFWFYLWLPLLALLAWTLGMQQAYKYMIVLGGYHDVIKLLAIYRLVIVLLGGALLAWAGYNIRRFSGVEHRTGSPAVTPKEIARDFGMDQLAVERWQAARYLHVTHDERGRIAGAEIPAAGAQVPL